MTVWQMRAFCKVVNVPFDTLPDHLSQQALGEPRELERLEEHPED